METDIFFGFFRNINVYGTLDQIPNEYVGWHIIILDEERTTSFSLHYKGEHNCYVEWNPEPGKDSKNVLDSFVIDTKAGYFYIRTDQMGFGNFEKCLKSVDGRYRYYFKDGSQMETFVDTLMDSEHIRLFISEDGVTMSNFLTKSEDYNFYLYEFKYAILTLRVKDSYLLRPCPSIVEIENYAKFINQIKENQL